MTTVEVYLRTGNPIPPSVPLSRSHDDDDDDLGITRTIYDFLRSAPSTPLTFLMVQTEAFIDRRSRAAPRRAGPGRAGDHLPQHPNGSGWADIRSSAVESAGRRCVWAYPELSAGKAGQPGRMGESVVVAHARPG